MTFKLVESVGRCGRHKVSDDEVFVVELLKGPGGLGLSLVDGVVRTDVDLPPLSLNNVKQPRHVCLFF